MEHLQTLRAQRGLQWLVQKVYFMADQVDGSSFLFYFLLSFLPSPSSSFSSPSSFSSSPPKLQAPWIKKHLDLGLRCYHLNIVKFHICMIQFFLLKILSQYLIITMSFLGRYYFMSSKANYVKCATGNEL